MITTSLVPLSEADAAGQKLVANVEWYTNSTSWMLCQVEIVFLVVV